MSYKHLLIGFLILATIPALKFLRDNYSVDGLLAQAETVAASQRCASARALYDLAIEYGTGFPAYEGRGICESRLGQFEAAKSDFREAAIRKAALASLIADFSLSAKYIRTSAKSQASEPRAAVLFEG